MPTTVQMPGPDSGLVPTDIQQLDEPTGNKNQDPAPDKRGGAAESEDRTGNPAPATVGLVAPNEDRGVAGRHQIAGLNGRGTGCLGIDPESMFAKRFRRRSRRGAVAQSKTSIQQVAPCISIARPRGRLAEGQSSRPATGSRGETSERRSRPRDSRPRGSKVECKRSGAGCRIVSVELRTPIAAQQRQSDARPPTHSFIPPKASRLGRTGIPRELLTKIWWRRQGSRRPRRHQALLWKPAATEGRPSGRSRT